MLNIYLPKPQNIFLQSNILRTAYITKSDVTIWNLYISGTYI